MLHDDGCGSSELTIDQAENKREMIGTSRMLLMLLEKFVSVVTSDAIINTQVQPEVRKTPFIGVCEKNLTVHRLSFVW
jgi:hypothetical protein